MVCDGLIIFFYHILTNNKTGACGMDQIRIYLLLNPKIRLGISELVSNAWGIDLNKYITLALTFSNFYTDSVCLISVFNNQCRMQNLLLRHTNLEMLTKQTNSQCWMIRLNLVYIGQLNV